MSSTYVSSTFAVAFPTLLALWLAPAGTKIRSPALNTLGLPAVHGISSVPSSRWRRRFPPKRLVQGRNHAGASIRTLVYAQHGGLPLSAIGPGDFQDDPKVLWTSNLEIVAEIHEFQPIVQLVAAD